MCWDPLGREKEFPLIFSTFSGKLCAFPRKLVCPDGTDMFDDPLIDDSLLMEVRCWCGNAVFIFCDFREFHLMIYLTWMMQVFLHLLRLVVPLVMVGERARPVW